MLIGELLVLPYYAIASRVSRTDPAVPPSIRPFSILVRR